MRLFHELVWDGYINGSAAVYSRSGLEALLGTAEHLSLGGYAAAVTGTSPKLTVQVEQSFDNVRWQNRNVHPEIRAVALSTTAETNFSGHDRNPSARPTAAFARLKISLGGTTPAGQVRIWATGRDPEGDTTPITILGAASVLQWCRGDLGVTLEGTDGSGNPRVKDWVDLTGAGNDYVQATTGKRPVWGGAPNGNKGIWFDGGDDELVAAGLNLPAPGTTPTYIWLVLYQSTWTSNDIVVGADGGTGTANFTSILQNPTTPSLRMQNGATQDNSGLALTTWGRVEAGFTNSTADFIKCRSTSVTGTNAGNNSGQTGRRIGKSQTTGSGFGNFGIAEIVYAKRIPTSAERAALDAYCTERYGAGLV